MLSPTFITEWLQEPRPLTSAEKAEVESLLREHPYFLPARFMEASEQHRPDSTPSPVHAMVQFYLSSWAFFQGMVQAASEATATGQEHVEEPALDEETEHFDDQLQETEDQEEYEEHASDEYEAELTEEPEEQETVASYEEPTEEYVETEPEQEEIVEEPTPVHVETEGLEAAILDTHHHEVSGMSVEDEEAMLVTTPDPEPEPEELVAAEPSVIRPLYTEDYFRHQGVRVSEELPEEDLMIAEEEVQKEEESSPGGDLMVMRSFAEWLMHFRARRDDAHKDAEGKRAIKVMWQKEKLAAAMEEEGDEIPEAVFEMAVSSITQGDDLISEPLATIYVKQGKWDKAIDVYRRLQLRNPAKSAYFAEKIAAVEQQKAS
jgi:hypothetical protein